MKIQLKTIQKEAEYEITPNISLTFGDNDNFLGEHHNTLGRLMNEGTSDSLIKTIRADFGNELDISVSLWENDIEIYSIDTTRVIYLFSRPKDAATFTETLIFVG